MIAQIVQKAVLNMHIWWKILKSLISDAHVISYQ